MQREADPGRSGRYTPGMKIASWNVNSLNARQEHLLAWLGSRQPDVVGLQETKLEDHRFPDSEIAALGYRSVFAGQKTYNGVAIEKYDYKLRWLEAVHGWLAEEIVRHPNLVVLGDFNIAPDDRDVHDPKAWNDDSILTSTAERAALRRLLDLGLVDSFRLKHDDAGVFSWWDYRAAGFRRNLGLRIDLVLLSNALAGRCTEASIDREPRTWERPSDHAPAMVTLSG